MEMSAKQGAVLHCRLSRGISRITVNCLFSGVLGRVDGKGYFKPNIIIH